MEHDIAIGQTSTLVACVPPLAARKALTRRGMLSNRVRTLPSRQHCLVQLRMPGLRAGQSMTSTSCWSKKAAVSRVVWGGAKLRPNTPVAHDNIWFLRIWMYRCQFIAPSTTTSSLLPPWWIAPHTMTDGPRFLSLGWTQASTSLSHCLRYTRTRPSLWYRENRDSSLKIQCLHCLRSHTLCLLPHSRRRRLCS